MCAMPTHAATKPVVGVLVAQLGTPDAPTARAVRPYLKQFLSDRRVIDYPPVLWQLILRGIILNVRPAKSAALYQRIWLDEGPPLLVYSQRQVEGLRARLGDGFRVALGMTYGQPSIRHALHDLEAAGIDRVLVLPMYPQYSSTTTASVYDAVFRAAAGSPRERKRFVPALRCVPPYYDHPGYIAGLADQIRHATVVWSTPPDRYVFSFHGIPRRYVRTGDPYPEQCAVTARLLAKALGLDASQWVLSYQSRFGPERWLEPNTDNVLEGLHAAGAERVVAVCPGFTVDCLETLDEIGREGREHFVHGGGHAENFLLAPCLNDNPIWLDALADIVREQSQGWA